MKKIINSKLLSASNFDELLDIKYGSMGTKKRTIFEAKAQNFITRQMLKAAPIQQNHTEQ